jgi:hypothetical protein
MSTLPLSKAAKSPANNSFGAIGTPIKRNLSSLNTDGDKSCVLYLFNMLAYVTIASAFSVIIAQLILLVASSNPTLPSILVRIYGVVLAGKLSI